MSEQSLLHLALPSPRLPRRSHTAGRSALVSMMIHAAVIAALATLMVSTARIGTAPAAPATTKTVELPRMVFLRMPGPGGGGGGGGNRQPPPPSRAQGVGRDQLTLPVAPPIVAQSTPTDSVPVLQSVSFASLRLASGNEFQIGMPGAPSSLPFSQGPGSGGGVGTGSGTGIGPGSGPGFGPGSGGGFGGGTYRPGNGVTSPTVLIQVRPSYTADAMYRKIQGTVVLQVIVGCDGVPSAIRVERSLDPQGLDDEAVRAVQQWRFNPGKLGGSPVEVLVNIVLEFRMY